MNRSVSQLLVLTIAALLEVGGDASAPTWGSLPS
jgi:hypothetical protein